MNFGTLAFRYNIDYLINNLLLLYAFTIPFSRNINKYIAIIILLLWIVQGGLKNKFILSYQSKTILLFSIFVIYSYISIFWSDYVKDAILYVNRYFYYFIFVVIFTSIKKEFIPKLIVSFLLAMFVSEIITYGIYFELWTTKYNEQMNLPFPTAFMGHSSYSLFVTFTALLTLNKLFSKNNDNNMIKLVYIILFLLTFGNLLISGGRTGLLVFCIALIIIPIVKYRKDIRYIILTISIIFVLFTAAYKSIELFENRINAGISDIDKILNQNDFSTSFGTRVGFIHLGIEIFKDNPILGAGIKDNISIRSQYALKDENKAMLHFTKWAVDTHFHNEYIEILTSIGLVGLFIFLYFLYSLFILKIDSSEYNNIKIIFMIVLIFGITTSALFHQRHTISLFALFIGLLLAQSKFEQEKDIIN